MNRNINIDLIKIIACIGVVGLHSVGLTNYTLYYLCTFAVPMFYMVNGYLMFSKDSITWKYVGNKVLSYGRLILDWNLLIIASVALIKHKFINPINECLRSIMQKGYLWHFWFFGAMIVINLALPVLFYIISRWKKMHYILFGINFLFCLGMTMYSIKSNYPMQAFIPQSIRLWTIFTFFLYGGLPVVKKINLGNVSMAVWGILIIVITCACNLGQKHLGNCIYHNRMAEYFYDELSVIIWSFMLFFFLLKLPVRKWIKRVDFIISLSDKTLGIFIIHPLVLKSIEFFNAKGYFSFLGYPSLVLLKMLVVLLISSGLTWGICRIKYVNKLVKL